MVTERPPRAFLYLPLSRRRPSPAYLLLFALLFGTNSFSPFLVQASRALQQKNHIIHALQLKLSELHEASHSDDSDLIGASHPLAEQTQLDQACLTCIELQASVQELAEQVNRLEAQFKRMSKENEDLRNALATAEKEACAREETVTELALMLASREASQVALVDTVHSYIARHITSLPATPRGPGEITDPPPGAKAAEGEGPATNSAQYWQERLQAQAEKAALKLRNLCPESRSEQSNAGSDSDDSGAAMVVAGNPNVE